MGTPPPATVTDPLEIAEIKSGTSRAASWKGGLEKEKSHKFRSIDVLCHVFRDKRIEDFWTVHPKDLTHHGWTLNDDV
jgi:hypothetical protein